MSGAVEELDFASMPREVYKALPAEERVERERLLARELGRYAGQWVLVRNATVVGSGDTMDSVLSLDVTPDSDRAFRVRPIASKLL